jgi:hypothetical protein
MAPPKCQPHYDLHYYYYNYEYQRYIYDYYYYTAAFRLFIIAITSLVRLHRKRSKAIDRSVLTSDFALAILLEIGLFIPHLFCSVEFFEDDAELSQDAWYHSNLAYTNSSIEREKSRQLNLLFVALSSRESSSAPPTKNMKPDSPTASPSSSIRPLISCAVAQHPACQLSTNAATSKIAGPKYVIHPNQCSLFIDN